MTMSAWIVSKRHINALVHGLTKRELVSGYTPSEIGRILWLENVKSIHARYPDTAETDRNYPGPNGFRKSRAEKFTYSIEREPVSINTLLMNVNCYDYQTCEHDGYESSLAHSWIAELKKSLTREEAIEPAYGSDEYVWGL
jgi:hypothetical protein